MDENVKQVVQEMRRWVRDGWMAAPTKLRMWADQLDPPPMEDLRAQARRHAAEMLRTLCADYTIRAKSAYQVVADEIESGVHHADTCKICWGKIRDETLEEAIAELERWADQFLLGGATDQTWFRLAAHVLRERVKGSPQSASESK